MPWWVPHTQLHHRYSHEELFPYSSMRHKSFLMMLELPPKQTDICPRYQRVPSANHQVQNLQLYYLEYFPLPFPTLDPDEAAEIQSKTFQYNMIGLLYSLKILANSSTGQFSLDPSSSDSIQGIWHPHPLIQYSESLSIPSE